MIWYIFDPPFNSKATYNVLFQEKNGTQSAAQITAFEDTWHWVQETEEAYHGIVTQGPKKLADLIQALRSFLGQNDMMAYLVMMAIRLVEMHRVLKPTGSIYLHCDPTASHYLKLVMDAIWGVNCYTNEIIWKRQSAHSDAGQGAIHMGRIHDVILRYSKSKKPTWNLQYHSYDQSYIDSFYRHIEEGTGRRYRLSDATGPGGASKGNPHYEFLGVTRYWRFSKEKMEQLYKQGRIVQTKPGTVPQQKRYLDEMPGIPIQDLWSDITPPSGNERLGYPTQKPEALLERIIKASSNEGDVILDPFCGCGTAIAVAERFNRRWIGIDITHLAITLMKHRLEDSFGVKPFGDPTFQLSPYEVIGDPKDLHSARALAEHDRYQFEWWAIGKVAARPAQDKKKGADSGIDGYIYFFDDDSGKAKTIVVQVKSGKPSVSQVRDLKGVLEREDAVIGAFITLNEPTEPMNTEAVTAGFYEPKLFPGKKYPKLQILTVEELLDGKELQYPKMAVATFKKAERKSKGGKKEQTSLFDI